MKLHTVLREREVEVTVDMAKAEPDVGIMSCYVDDYTVTDEETRERLDWELTDSELNELANQADEQAFEMAHCEPDEYDRF